MIGLFWAACLLRARPAWAGVIDYPIGPDSADIRFHTLVAGTVPVDGAFTRFAGHILLDPAHPEAVRIAVTVMDDAMDVPFGGASMLRAPAYFDYRRTPEIRFTSDHAAIGADGQFTVAGQLTIRGVTRPEELAGTVTRSRRDGVDVLQVAAHGRLDRTEFGMVADRPLIADGVTLRITATLRLP
ncbi:MAG TPA: YceI family protein [Acidisoma sp.]|nr:YceI family protein [Acidisoma sp.]